MYGLDVERLLDFGVWSDDEMKEDQDWEEKSENRRSYRIKPVSLFAWCSCIERTNYIPW